MRKKFLLSLLFALPVLFFLYQKIDRESHIRETITSSENIAAVNKVNEEKVDFTDKNKAPNSANELEHSLSTAYYDSDDLSLLIEDLKARSGNGDAVASRYVYQILEECQNYSIAPDTHFSIQRELANRFQDESAKQQALLLIERAELRCSGYRYISPVSDEEKKAWLVRAAEQGDIVATLKLINEALLADSAREAWGVNEGSQAIKVNDAAIQAAIIKGISSGDPEAMIGIAEMMPSMSNRSTLAGPYIGGEENYYLWLLLACDHGLSCGKSSFAVRSYCQHQGFCQYTSLEQIIFEQLVSPAQATRMHLKRLEVNRLIEISNFQGVFNG